MHALLSRLRHLNCSTRRLRCIFADSTIPSTWYAPEIDIYVYVGFYFFILSGYCGNGGVEEIPAAAVILSTVDQLMFSYLCICLDTFNFAIIGYVKYYKTIRLWDTNTLPK